MLNNSITRRNVLFGASALTFVSALPAVALTEAGATKLINSVIGQINSVIASGQSEAAMIKQFENIFVRYSDVPTIARYTLGVAARSASASQLRSFTDAFTGYISRKYGKRFREFMGGRLEVQQTKAVKSFYEVKTLAYLPGSAPFDVTFLVSDKSGKDLFFNMFIEGVNLLLTEREEIGAMLDRRGGSIDSLIADLQRAG
ncbi:phospholipid-binding protein MlaC [Donghicola sp. XS_ASV15]|uniref:MlaC/ttg2D family ABC transporter substrate-binding protein n=1 Tax=Donghicola sp. XS_ASV15 TaxID=3241295 RepID=UPI003519343E